MASAVRINAATANAMLDTIGNRANNGKLRIYSGTQPAAGGGALSGNTLLAELTLGADAFPAASGGVLTAAPIADDAAADNTGTATWFRIVESDGSTHVIDGSVGTTGADDLVLATTSIVAGAVVQISSLTITQPLV